MAERNIAMSPSILGRKNMNLIKKFAIVTAPALALVALSGCATSFKADVARFQQLPTPAGQSFTVVADDPRLAGGLEFAEYAGSSGNALHRRATRLRQTLPAPTSSCGSPIVSIMGGKRCGPQGSARPILISTVDGDGVADGPAHGAMAFMTPGCSVPVITTSAATPYIPAISA